MIILLSLLSIVAGGFATKYGIQAILSGLGILLAALFGAGKSKGDGA